MWSKAFLVFLAGFANVVQGMEFVHMDNAIVNLREDFTQLGQAVPTVEHEVIFVVKQKNLDKLETILYEVSDPKSPKYGNHLTRAQVAELTANPEATESVKKFLNEHGVNVVKTTPHGEYITAKAPIATWESLFSTKFYNFQHEEKSTKPVVRALEYSLPKDLLSAVEGVYGTTQLPDRKAPRPHVALKESTAAAGTVTPAFLNSYYHVTTNTGNGLGSQAVFESLEQYYSPNDLLTFEAKYGIPAQNVTEDIGGYVSDQQCIDSANNCAEANLDVQYLIGMAQDVPTTYWYDGATDSFFDWITAVAASPSPPLVNSISYGAVEPELPTIVANAFNTEAMKLGVQGVSIFVSSGDDGVANFQARSNPRKCGYNPSFPASSPYVTAVGATQGPESGKTEVACTSNGGGVITTGGGFSTKFSAPTYQQAAISNYFATLPAAQQPVTGYAAAGRGYPDVAMAGYNYEVIIGGAVYKLSGTSASAPVVASFVSLVNAARLKNGKKPLGFINPALYTYGTALTNDVVGGENNCAASIVCCDQGFYAAAGWDPLTGFGSVDFTSLYNKFVSL